MIKKILALFVLCFFLSFDSVFSDNKILSPEEYVTYLAQDTLNILDNKNKND